MIDEKKMERPNPFREERIRRIQKQLEKQNEVKIGNAYLVRIPKIEGKILLWKRGQITYVAYIYKKWYDAEKKQNRNLKTIIGQCIDLIPGAMVTNDKYYEYFDRTTGELKEEEEPMDQENAEWMKELERKVHEDDGEKEEGREEEQEAVNSELILISNKIDK